MSRRPSNVLSIIDAATVRVSTYAPADAGWPGESAGPSEWREWIREAWATTALRAAVSVASPVLAGRVSAALGPTTDASSANLHRVAHSLARYLVRLEGRATPFGLFAGVAPLTFGDELRSDMGDDHRSRTRVDSAWIAAIIAELERLPAVRACLLVTFNDLCTVRGDRLLVMWRPHASWGSGTGENTGGCGLRGSSLPYTLRIGPAVRAILDAAQKPVSVRELIDVASVAQPLKPLEYFDLLVGRLIEVGALITCLRPNGTTSDVLSHLLVELCRTGASEVADAKPTLERLQQVRELMREVDEQPWISTEAREKLAGEMLRAPSATMSPFVVNLRYDCSVVLPSSVADEALAAAHALLWTGQQRDRRWGAYHAAFVARYGFGAIVPVRELTDPDAGLGFPAHFTNDADASGITVRDELLLRLAHEAVVDGRLELVLDEQLLRRFEAAEPGIRQMPSNLDVCLDVRAATTDDLAAGRFMLGMRGLGRSAAATAGRFIELFDEGDRRRMLKAFREVPPCTIGGIVAQLSSPPSNASLENVVHTLPMVKHVISLGEHRPVSNNHLRLDDLAVTADSDRFYLVSMERRCTVQPLMGNAAARHTMPLIARFLSEISRAGNSPLAPFSWGLAARHLPMRPRVRYRRTMLSPAQWTVSADASAGGAWEDRVDEIRLKLGDAAVVQVGTGDQLLRLDLDEARDRAVLREYVRGKNSFTLAEAAGRPDYGWIGGRAHEIVVPMVSTKPPIPAPPGLAADAPLPVVTVRDAVLPGGEVVFARLYGPRDLADDIITGHLPALLAAWERPPMCWWIRFRDPSDHLRLRLHVTDFGQAATRVGAWAAALRDLGLSTSLVLDSYWPETARYGHGAILQAAERLFAADSHAAAAQLCALKTQRRWSPRALTAASLVDLACAMMGSYAAGIRWLVESPAKRSPGVKRPRLDPDLVRQARSFTPQSSAPAELAEVWQQRRTAAAEYAGLLRGPSTHLEAKDVLGSLLHMHHNRVYGIDPDHESQTHRLARAIALTTTHLLGSGGA